MSLTEIRSRKPIKDLRYLKNPRHVWTMGAAILFWCTLRSMSMTSNGCTLSATDADQPLQFEPEHKISADENIEDMQCFYGLTCKNHLICITHS